MPHLHLPHLHPHFHLPHFHPNIFKALHHDGPESSTLDTPTSNATHSARTTSTWAAVHSTEKEPPCCPAKMIVFTVNLLIGLVLSQLVPEWLDGEPLYAYRTGVKILTMWHLSYIMIHVGYEFDIDKSRRPSSTRSDSSAPHVV